jgi:hypothetical protein
MERKEKSNKSEIDKSRMRDRESHKDNIGVWVGG